jgi:galactokinase
MCILSLSPPKDRLQKQHKWSNYVVCGALGVLEEAKKSQSVPVCMMVDGRVPIGSGLSSSSAMVCCGALAMARINGITLNPSRTAFVAAQSERWIGMESGGMDQAISLLARAGSALHIQFDPIRVAPVPLAANVAVVIVDSE